MICLLLTAMYSLLFFIIIAALHALAVVSSELGAVSLYDFLSLHGTEVE